MALSQLVDFLKAAKGYIRPDAAAVDEAGASKDVAARFHRRIVVIAGSFGLIAALGGVVGAFLEPPDGKASVKMIRAAPLVFGVMGILEGVAVACLFAPREFLTGPVGQKWMSLIGTKSVFGAPITCAVLALAIPGVPATLTLLASFGKG